MTPLDPRAAVDALAASRAPYLLGVRHHSPALATVVPALLDEMGAEVVCVELPADFQPWLEHLADPETVAPVALAGAGEGGRLSFYPFADFSPELAAVRWARERGAEVLCCDLPLSDPGWGREDDPGGTGSADGGDADSGAGAGGEVRRSYAAALSAAGTGRDGEDMWDRAVEVLAPGCAPEAVRRAALGVGWALRSDAAVPATDLAREARMRQVIAAASEGGRRVAAVVGAFHAPALVASPCSQPGEARGTVEGVGGGGGGGIGAAGAAGSVGAAGDASTARDADAAGDAGTAGDAGAADSAGNTVAAGDSGTAEDAGAAGAAGVARAPGAGQGAGPGARTDAGSRTDAGARTGTGARTGVGAGKGTGIAVTSLVPYSFDLLDSRSGYPAGIRDPLWQQAVLDAAGDADRLRVAASTALTGVCRELRRAGHTAGTGEAVETLRLACDLATLRGLPAPGRGELLEAITTVLGQGEPLGRGLALARALEAVFVGTARGRVGPRAPRSGLGPAVEDELARLRLPGAGDPDPREVRLDPLRSPLDGRREVLLRRLLVIGASYGEPLSVAATGDGTALGTKWRLRWTPSVAARLDLAGVRGVTPAQAAAGALGETARREAAEGGPTPAQIVAGLTAAVRCDLPELVDVRLREAREELPEGAELPELLEALDLLEGMRRGHHPGTTPEARATADALSGELLDAAVRSLPGLAGSDDPADAKSLVALADRSASRHLGLRLERALAELASDGAPLMQGAALAVRVALDLEPAAGLGERVADWVDGATVPSARRALTKRLTGLLAAAGPLLQASPDALAPLLDRVESLPDQEFLDRLPALRGGFDVLAPAARERLLHAVTERLGDRLDLSLDAPPALLALWAAADAAGLAALKAPGLLPGTDAPDSAVAPDRASAPDADQVSVLKPDQTPALGTEQVSAPDADRAPAPPSSRSTAPGPPTGQAPVRSPAPGGHSRPPTGGGFCWGGITIGWPPGRGGTPTRSTSCTAGGAVRGPKIWTSVPGRAVGRRLPSPPPGSGRPSWRRCSGRMCVRRSSRRPRSPGAPMCSPSWTRRRCGLRSSC
ncbi:DUF5682 family protein [Streptomyces sp. CBMA291]|uniref:DUF5682 family protein n=1 Tax=unclassified Streptomyces TaxID=2593676 RepID=UPI00398181F0